MLKFLLRRFANYLVLVGLATCLGYFLAASSLNPRANYEGRNPRRQESVNAKLDDLNLNDQTPVVERFTRWVSDVRPGRHRQDDHRSARVGGDEAPDGRQPPPPAPRLDARRRRRRRPRRRSARSSSIPGSTIRRPPGRS